jgi:hypothetical protein
VIVPSPVPLEAELIVSQGVLVDAVHAQVGGDAVTAI